MFQDHRQSPLKALLNTFGMYRKTHSMVTRYGSHDTENIPPTQDSPPLDLAPEEHHMLKGDNESSEECCEETDTHYPLAELSENSVNLKTNSQAWNLPLLNLHLQQSWHSSQINCSTSPWCPNHSQNPSQVRNQCKNHLDVYIHLAHHTERIKPHHNHVARHTHIWWTGLLKTRGLVHGHRNFHWHPNRKPHIPGWGQAIWFHPHRKVLGWNQGHP